MLRLILVCLSAIGLVGSAHAQKIRAADTGAVDLILTGPDVQYFEPITIDKGDVLWVETIRPMHVRTLIDDVEKRMRPSIPPVASGTPLIGVRIESGIAFCPSITYEAPVSRVQCFQDFDGDMKFDGGYYTDQRGFDTQFLSGWLRGLAGLAPKISYANADDTVSVPHGQVTVQYNGMRRGTPRFRLYVEQERVDDLMSCEVPEDGICELMGRRFQFAENDDDSVTFTPIGEAEQRAFSFYSKSSFR